ncbi:branched-chain amino acid ABC transporter permease [Noviherbaspirillum sp.]|uniref:branched-chain amino acid ABC transporter permease n=1 Tax=Noviherbaspirillum sp. TaxID=1926288 RepID=UPI002B47EB01|nr:branched-chain amino acid ABC transporter permease [Noviherbaspirillum sp.]HJV80961.1 branched-chain amino acid ABC transporter permease [Noviherbaspirillum sp.]
MSGYTEAMLALLAINFVVALAGYLPLAAGQLNLGVAGFMAIGGYVSAYLTNTYDAPIYLGVITGGLVASVIATLLAVPLLRVSGIYLALATFALGQVIQGVLLNLEVVGAAAGYAVNKHASFGFIVTSAAIVLGLVFFLTKTRFALYLTAVKNDPVVSDLFGLNVKITKIQAFSLGALIAGIGGALYGHHFSYLEPQNFNILLSIYIALYVLLGGTQTIFGPLAGALIFTLLPEVLRGSDQWRYVVFALAVILIMAVRPQGLITAQLLRNWSGRTKPAEAK